MAEHLFQVTIHGRLDGPTLDALFDAGCDDATFSSKDNLALAEFAREATTILAAVISAIEEIETVQGLHVIRVEPDELVWASEIAQRTGRSRQSIEQLIKGKRGPGGFPAPLTHATRNPLWRWQEVEAWFAAYEGWEPDTERAAVLAAVNAILELRCSLETVAEPGKLRAALNSLLAKRSPASARFSPSERKQLR